MNRDLNVETTLAILESAETRTWRNDKGYLIHEIFYDGQWRRLGRVDLHNQAATFSVDSDISAPSLVARYKQSCCFGARVKHNAFLVIDSFTDG